MTADFRFYGALNDFLPRAQRHTTLRHPFDWRASVKDMLESLGPPHPEVTLILVNGTPVTFEYIVQPGDQVEVYPHDHGLSVSPEALLIPPYPGRPRFILDTHLGRLEAYLRMMGFDTLYRNDYPDDELARISDEETRILLTRDIGLLKRSRVVYGYFVRNTAAQARLHEINRRYQLARLVAPFRYCMKCNGLLVAVEKSAILHLIHPRTAQAYEAFHQCATCQQVYWKGSHYDRMAQLLEDIIQDRPPDR